MALKIKIEEFGKPRKYKRRGCSVSGNYEHLKPYQFKAGNQLAKGGARSHAQQRFDKEVQAALLEDAPPELRKMAGLAGKRCVTTIYALVRVLIRLAGTGELDALLAVAKLNDGGTDALRHGNMKVDARKQQVVQWVVKYPKPEEDDDGSIENRAAIEGHALGPAPSAAFAGETQDR